MWNYHIKTFAAAGNAVLADINRFADMAVNDEKAVRAIEKRLSETDQSKAMEKEQN